MNLSISIGEYFNNRYFEITSINQKFSKTLIIFIVFIAGKKARVKN